MGYIVILPEGTQTPSFPTHLAIGNQFFFEPQFPWVQSGNLDPQALEEYKEAPVKSPVRHLTNSKEHRRRQSFTAACQHPVILEPSQDEFIPGTVSKTPGVPDQEEGRSPGERDQWMSIGGKEHA